MHQRPRERKAELRSSSHGSLLSSRRTPSSDASVSSSRSSPLRSHSSEFFNPPRPPSIKILIGIFLIVLIRGELRSCNPKSQSVRPAHPAASRSVFPPELSHGRSPTSAARGFCLCGAARETSVDRSRNSTKSTRSHDSFPRPHRLSTPIDTQPRRAFQRRKSNLLCSIHKIPTSFHRCTPLIHLRTALFPRHEF